MKRAAGALAVSVGLLAGTAAPAHAAPTITLSGEQVTQALVSDLAYFYRHHTRHPARFALSAGGTSAGIADTVRGVSQGALVSRPLAPDDPPGLRLTELALSGVCLVTNLANPVPALSRDELQDIVAARATNWTQIAGSPRGDPIVPVDLGETTGAGRVFGDVFVDPATPFAWQPVTVQTTAQARDYVQSNPAAFGYVDLALAGPVHRVSYQGVPCTRATIRDGSYPARRPLGVVTVGAPKGALARFLRWSRSSPVARRVIATRYIPG